MALFSSDYPHVEGGRNPLKPVSTASSRTLPRSAGRQVLHLPNFIDMMGAGLPASVYLTCSRCRRASSTRATRPKRVNRPTGELSVLADDIAFVEAFSHVISFRTDDGMVLFDTSVAAFGPAVRDALAWVGTRRSRARWCTRTGTSITWAARRRSWPRPPIVGILVRRSSRTRTCRCGSLGTT